MSTTEDEKVTTSEVAPAQEVEHQEEPKEEQATTSEEKKDDSSEENSQESTASKSSDKYDELVASVAAGGGTPKDGVQPPNAAPSGPPTHPLQNPSQHPPHPHHQGPQPPMPHHQYPPHMGYPPQYQQYPPYQPGRHHPGYPPGYPPAGYPPGPPAGYPGYPPGPPGMMRGPPGPVPPQTMVGPTGELVRMPPGPTPTEWAAQQQRIKEPAPNGKPATPSSSNQPAPSPAASSIAEESLDEKPKNAAAPPPPPQQPQGIMSPMPTTPQHPAPASVNSTPHTDGPKVPVGKVLTKQEVLDKLVGPINKMNPAHVMPERRNFFERLVEFCERNGDPIQVVPQVSKQCIDLHRLYIGVRNRGGFQQVTKEKMWKVLCTEANPDLSESSAAGYQLRKHYQKHLLLLECVETGRNPEDEVAFADKLKRQRKRDTGGAPAATPATPQVPNNAQVPPPQQFPGNGTAPQPGQFHPGMDPNYYYQQHGMMPPHYPPQHMQNFSPGQYPGRIPPGAQPPPGQPTAMRAPMPQNMAQHEMDEHQRQAWMAQQHQMQQQQQQQAAAMAAASSGSSTQPATPSASNSEAVAQAASTSQAGSRAPSAGPSATPDSTSRMSGGADTAENSNTAEEASTSSAPPAPAQPAQPQQQPPPQQVPPQPGQPPYYPPGPYPPPQMRQPGFAPAPYAYPGGPHPPPPHPGYHPAAHPSHPQHAQFMAWQQQQQHQRYVQQQQQQQAQQQQQRYPPNYPRPQQPPQAPSPSTIAKRYPQQPPQQVPVPQQARGLPIPSTSQAIPQQSQQASATQPQYPPGCVESTTATQQIKRRKIFARELYNATPRRLIMAMRSGLDAEAVWAINSLTILLYDDSNPQPSLQQMPGLLNVIVEHLYATLAILYPKHFELDEPGKPQIFDDSKTLVQQLIDNKTGDLKLFVDRMPVITRKSSADKNQCYTMKSRNGIAVQFRDEKMPRFLTKRVNRENAETENREDSSLTTKYVEERARIGLGGGLAERIYAKLKDKLVIEEIERKPVFSKYEVINNNNTQEDNEEKEEEEEEDLTLAMLKGAEPEELSECKHEKELGWPKPSALCPKSEKIEQLTQRALALSNILRGFSFVPGSEHLMAKDQALLYILGRFLKLYVHEKRIVAQKRNIVLNPDELKKVPENESLDEQREKALAVLDVDDANETMLIETANLLRDDSFVMLSHMSVSLALFDLPSSISYPIYDGLLHWAVSSVPEATDYTLPIVVSPRDYSLEIMCKMVVVDRNVDMFLSTGKWSRMEKFVNMLAKLLTMNEETHYREFAIVILNALCVLNEAVCYLCAIETNAINHLILFIDSADQNMHQVMQQHGMTALRDNPELMGTSVGMLRRAASMLKLLIKVPMAYRTFLKHQQRLLQFTMSQLMDSRVAAMVADTLYEVQDLVREFGEDIPEKSTFSLSSKASGSGENQAKKEEKNENGEELNENGKMENEEEKKENHHEQQNGKNETNEEDEIEDEEESQQPSSFKLKQQKNNAYKRSAIIDEQSRSPPTKRSCLTNGFDKKSSQQTSKTNGTLSETTSTQQPQKSHDGGAMTTAVA